MTHAKDEISDSIEKQEPLPQRPLVSDYTDPILFLKDTLDFRKKTERSFSILSATKSLRKVSPALVTLIIQRKRVLTFDRTDEFAKLMGLSHSEKVYFREMIFRQQYGDKYISPSNTISPNSSVTQKKNVSSHLLQDWINAYVKDCFQIPAIQKNPKKIYPVLAHLASQKRIDRAIQFLLKEGHLSKNSSGHIFITTQLTVTQTVIPSQKIREFHGGALNLAKQALENYGPNERFANTVIIPMSKLNYNKLLDLIQSFAEQLQEFASQPTEELLGYQSEHSDPDLKNIRLYQVLINVSPTGGKSS